MHTLLEHTHKAVCTCSSMQEQNNISDNNYQLAIKITYVTQFVATLN